MTTTIGGGATTRAASPFHNRDADWDLVWAEYDAARDRPAPPVTFVAAPQPDAPDDDTALDPADFDEDPWAPEERWHAPRAAIASAPVAAGRFPRPMPFLVLAGLLITGWWSWLHHETATLARQVAAADGAALLQRADPEGLRRSLREAMRAGLPSDRLGGSADLWLASLSDEMADGWTDPRALSEALSRLEGDSLRTLPTGVTTMRAVVPGPEGALAIELARDRDGLRVLGLRPAAAVH